MARIPDIDRRLDNWARWRAGGRSGGLGFASVNLATAFQGRSTDREAIIPTLDAEAEITDRGVLALASELRATVEQAYLHGGSVARKCTRLACSEATYHSRIDRAHRELAAWLTEREAAARAQRERVERIAGGFTH